MLLTERALIGGDAHAVIGVGADLRLVDQIPHSQRVGLRGTEDEGLLMLVNRLHEELDAVVLAFPDFDDAVEIVFGVASVCLYLALDQFIVRGIDVFIYRERHLVAALGAWSARCRFLLKQTVQIPNRETQA